MDKTAHDDSCSYVKSDEQYQVTGWVIWLNEYSPRIFPTEVSDEKLTFCFSRMDYGYWKFVEKNIMQMFPDPQTKMSYVSYNFVKLRMFIVKFLLKRWDIPIELKFDNHGILTDDCFSRVMSINPAIMRYFVEKIENLLFMSDAERETIARQSLMLFGKANVGVKEPGEAISLYCDLTGFWDKFGLNYFDLQQLPQELYMKLRMVMTHEIDVRNQHMANTSKPPPRGARGKQMINHTSF